MFKLLAQEFVNQYSFLNLFNFITFRVGASILTSLFFSLIFGQYIIKKLSTIQPNGQPIRNDGPEAHIIKKVGTPTMGGILIILSIITSSILWCDLENSFIWIGILSLITFGFIGIVDDYKKIKSNSSNGLKASKRIVLQIVFSFLISVLIISVLDDKIDTSIAFPFFKNLIINFGYFYLFISIFILVGSANAVNLTDGLDGLATVPVMLVALSFTLICYVVGNTVFSEYLQIPYIPNIGEASIFCGSIVGSCLGFLWFNAPPAKIFMGDTGSLSLGGSLGAVGIITKHEIVLAITGGLFVLEALSVVVQVISFKLTGKRIFKMAPIHHHFEKKGWAESTVVVRFWIISIILAMIGLATLKLR